MTLAQKRAQAKYRATTVGRAAVKEQQRRNRQRPAYKLRIKRYLIALRLLCLRAYSGEIPHCSCCGEKHIEFLAFDHIAGGGNEHKRREKISSGTGFYCWLRKHNFPDGFRVLCHNCNMSHGFYGYCPHQNIV